MKLKKYQKEYNRFNKATRKAYGILKKLYDEINNDEELKNKKDISSVKCSLEYFMSYYTEILLDINDIDFTQLKNIKHIKPNNLLILPLYPDEDIYVPVGSTISDFINYTKD